MHFISVYPTLIAHMPMITLACHSGRSAWLLTPGLATLRLDYRLLYWQPNCHHIVGGKKTSDALKQYKPQVLPQ